MGFAIAAEAEARGADVTLIAGHVDVPPPPRVALMRVGTAREMAEACIKHFPSMHVAIGAAAVADYAPEAYIPTKIKKTDGPADDRLTTIRLRRNPDIIATLAAERREGQLVVGFAAETEDLAANATRKLARKNLDLIVANDVSATDSGFETETNRVSLFWSDGRRADLPLRSKREVASHILDAVSELLRSPHPIEIG